MDLYPRVLAWHRYLATQRDPDSRGVLVIYHPWESGTDNSPRWDAALGRVQPGDLPAFQRHDLKVVQDPTERPSQREYERYLWLVELLKQCGYDDARIQRAHPFRVRDVLMSAIFAAACAALSRVRPEDAAELNEYTDHFTRGVLYACEAESGLALDYDDISGEPVRVQTCAGLAPLLLPRLEPEAVERLVGQLTGRGFAGAPGLAYPVVPSTAVNVAEFHPRAYWRGPAWPVFNWLVWWGLGRHGRFDVAERLRSANLALLGRPGSDFGEYFEPYTSEPLGSLQQSWSAAVALDWLASPN